MRYKATQSTNTGYFGSKFETPTSPDSSAYAMNGPLGMSKPPRERPAADKQQVAAFRKAARQLGCDESEDRFASVLKKVATAPHNDSKRPSPKPAKRSS